MRGAGGSGRAMTSRGPGDWSSRDWLGRRCRLARLQLQRALRGGGGVARLRAGIGSGVLMASAAGAGAASPSPSPDGSGGGSQQEQQRPRSWSDFGHPRRRTTDVFMVLNAAVFALNWLSKDVLLIWGCKVNALIAAGQWWRLVTPMFLHSNLFHLAINMHALHTLGPQVEVVSGSRRTAVIYMVSGVFATIASFMMCPAPSLGASGAVFGLGAALAVFYWRHREVLGPASESGLRSLGLTAAINIAYSMANKKIDNWGHTGGLIGGALLAFLLGPAFTFSTARGGSRGLQDKPPLPWLAFQATASSGGGGAGGGGGGGGTTASLPSVRRLAAEVDAGGSSGGGSGGSGASSGGGKAADSSAGGSRRSQSRGGTLPFLRGRGPPPSAVGEDGSTRLRPGDGGGGGGSGGGGGGDAASAGSG